MAKKPTPVCEIELPEGSRIKLAEHGTLKRYNQMFRLGVERCGECKAANTKRDVINRAKKGAATTDLPDLDSIKVSELKAYCRANGISGFDGLKKAGLISHIVASR